MRTLKRIFGWVRPAYYLRAYIIGAIFLGGYFLLRRQATASEIAQNGMLPFLAICTLLFPFSKLVWDEFKALMRGDTITIMPLLWSVAGKLIINLMLWIFAPFVAPFGLLYLWFRSRHDVV